MLWFKHIANSTSDPDLMSAVLEFGSDAYYVFFVTLELLTKEAVFDEPKSFKWSFYKTFFPHIHGPKLRRILVHFSETAPKRRTNGEQTARFSATFDEQTVTLFSSKLSDLSRSYNKKLGNKTETIWNHRREKREERRKKKTIHAPSAAAAVPEKGSEEKKGFAEFVTMTQTEFDSLQQKFGDSAKVERAIEILDNYKGAKGKTYKSDYKAILTWVVDRMAEESAKRRPVDSRPASVDPIKAKREKIKSMVESALLETYLTESEAWSKYNEETSQRLNRATISELEAGYFAGFLREHYRKEGK